jgi:hypothetical protein
LHSVEGEVADFPAEPGGLDPPRTATSGVGDRAETDKSAVGRAEFALGDLAKPLSDGVVLSALETDDTGFAVAAAVTTCSDVSAESRNMTCVEPKPF